MANAQDALNVPVLLNELQTNRLKWNKLGPSTYELQQTRQCFCPAEFRGPFVVSVVNDVKKSVVFAPDSDLSGQTPPDGALDFLFTVDGAFDFVEEALGQNPARVTVEYDSALSYITNFFIDRDLRIADEELGFEFKLLLSVTPPVVPIPIPIPGPIPVPIPGPIPVPTPGPSPPRGIPAALELRLNRKKWEAVGPKSYKYRLRRLCFCLPGFVGPFLITVKNGKVVDVVFEGQGSKPAELDVPTIDGLFDIIAKNLGKVAKITVKYDFALGFPTSIAIDRIALAIDDEITYTAELVEGGRGIFGKLPRGKPFKLGG